MKAPATLDEFYHTFPTERRCWEALRRMRWPDGFRCPRCQGRKAHPLRARGLWQCAGCRYQTSVTAGTPFHGTRVPLRSWFLAIFFVARHKQGISALQFQRDAGLGSYKTAWTLLHKVRSALAPNPLFRVPGNEERMNQVDRLRSQAPALRHRMGRGLYGAVVALAVIIAFYPSRATADLYKGWVEKRIDNSNWVLVIEGQRFFVRMSMCLSLALPMDEVVVKSDDQHFGAGDEVLFIDDGEECWVAEAGRLS